MPRLLITSESPGAGKTGVATAIARHVAYTGRPVLMARLATAETASFAADDASLFGAAPFAPGSPASRSDAAGIADLDTDAVQVIEANAAEVGDIEADYLIVVARAGEPLPDPGSAAAVIITGAPHNATMPDAPNVFVLPEDRTLAGFTVAELRTMLQAEVINEGDVDDPVCDNLVIAPFGSDSGLPYFDLFQHKAVVARFDRTDMHLAAIRSEPTCLVLTGGRYPSDYVYDASRAMGIPVLLSWADTESTVITLEELWDRTQFTGERKLDRMTALLAATGFFGWLDGALES